MTTLDIILVKDQCHITIPTETENVLGSQLTGYMLPAFVGHILKVHKLTELLVTQRALVGTTKTPGECEMPRALLRFAGSPI
ncbi:unnamed protein product [Allacma fusca]|uniref:Uncharacterized protein n=1 Tax=Allacma fusca TaxID=39272 RepID=A0A8J2KXY9_9HEXA|nr:unnamed protein product [Allacma fusca]